MHWLMLQGTQFFDDVGWMLAEKNNIHESSTTPKQVKVQIEVKYVRRALESVSLMKMLEHPYRGIKELV